MEFEKIKTEEQLVAKINHCAKCMDLKFHCVPGKKAIAICGVNGCQAGGSAEETQGKRSGNQRGYQGPTCRYLQCNAQHLM